MIALDHLPYISPHVTDRWPGDLIGAALPGTPSTVVDLRGYEDTGEWRIVRAGAVPAEVIAASA